MSSNRYKQMLYKKVIKHGLGLALNMRREKFWHFSRILWILRTVYLNEIPTQLPGTLTHALVLADLAFVPTSPNSSLQQPPFSDCCQLLSVNCSGTLSFLKISCKSPLCGFRTKTDKGILWLALTHTHRTNAHDRVTLIVSDIFSQSLIY